MIIVLCVFYNYDVGIASLSNYTRKSREVAKYKTNNFTKPSGIVRYKYPICFGTSLNTSLSIYVTV